MRTMTWMVLALVASACGDPDDEASGDTGRPECSTDACTDHFAVAQTIDYVFPDDDGKLDGFDIDGRISDTSDAEGCNRQDFESVDGRKGIDNQSSILMELLMGVTGEAIDGYTKTAIEDGDLLMVLGIEGVDDPMDDDCVLVSSFPVVIDKVVLGTDGLLVTDQTFDLHPDHPVIRSECAVMKNGIVEAGPFESVMPIYIVKLSVDLRIHNTNVRAELHDDGAMDILVAGGAEVEQLIELVTQSETGEVIDSGIPAIKALADLEPNADGECQQLSQTTVMQGVRAFLF